MKGLGSDYRHAGVLFPSCPFSPCWRECPLGGKSNPVQRNLRPVPSSLSFPTYQSRSTDPYSADLILLRACTPPR